MIKYPGKKAILISLTCLTSLLLTACGDAASFTTGNTSGTAVQTKTAEPPSMSVPEQLDVFLSHKDTWLKKDLLMTSEEDPDSYAKGPNYSLMDLDQDGYIELIVTNEKNQSCPAYYEVTEDKSLKQWTTEGDLPQSENFSIFDLTGKANCYYDSSRGEYHYIVMDYLSLCQDEADASFLEMTPSNDHVTFKKIGKYTFDAFEDNTRHYFNHSGKECKENELYNNYSDMIKKTIYYKKMSISAEDAKKLTADTLTDTLWNKFLMRDNYRCEKEKDLTEDIEHQFFYQAITKEDCTRGTWADADEIRFTATDLDNDKNIELIIENQTKNDYCIYEYDDENEGKWDTKGKDLASFTKETDNIDWQTCTLKEFEELDDEFLEDLLRECWLKFS